MDQEAKTGRKLGLNRACEVVIAGDAYALSKKSAEAWIHFEYNLRGKRYGASAIMYAWRLSRLKPKTKRDSHFAGVMKNLGADLGNDYVIDIGFHIDPKRHDLLFAPEYLKEYLLLEALLDLKSADQRWFCVSSYRNYETILGKYELVRSKCINNMVICCGDLGRIEPEFLEKEKSYIRSLQPEYAKPNTNAGLVNISDLYRGLRGCDARSIARDLGMSEADAVIFLSGRLAASVLQSAQKNPAAARDKIAELRRLVG